LAEIWSSSHDTDSILGVDLSLHFIPSVKSQTNVYATVDPSYIQF